MLEKIKNLFNEDPEEYVVIASSIALIFGLCLGMLLLGVGTLLLTSLFLMVGLNYLAEIWGFQPVTYLQSISMMVLFHITIMLLKRFIEMMIIYYAGKCD